VAEALALESRRVGAATVLFGPRGGKYPDGNSVLVRGREESLLIDPSLGLLARRGALPQVDHALLSHCHEDHLAGLFLFPDAACHVHEADRIGLQSLDGMLAIYGFAEPVEAPWRRALVEQFHYAPRRDARGFAGERVFELGGGVRVRAIPAPGHTRGHCVLLIEPGGQRDRAALRELRKSLPFLDIAIANPTRFRRYVTCLFAADRDAVPKGMVEVLAAPRAAGQRARQAAQTGQGPIFGPAGPAGPGGAPAAPGGCGSTPSRGGMAAGLGVAHPLYLAEPDPPGGDP